MPSKIDTISRDNPLRVLITCPRLSSGGGVSNYCNTIRGWFSIKADFFGVGAVRDKETASEKMRHLWTDRMRFYNLLKDSIGTYDLVHLNPSFDYKATVRDGLLLRVAKEIDQKIIVMFMVGMKLMYRLLNDIFSIIFFRRIIKLMPLLFWPQISRKN